MNKLNLVLAGVFFRASQHPPVAVSNSGRISDQTSIAGEVAEDINITLRA